MIFSNPYSFSLLLCSTASQVSRAIHLDKSIRYYIEVLRIGVGGNDFAALGIQMPSGSFETPIQKSKFQRILCKQIQRKSLLLEYDSY